MPTYLIAPDSFKGSISAIQFCEIAQQVISQKQPDGKINQQNLISSYLPREGSSN